MSKHTLRRKGFTLVELLVVIGIIALLISILLPSLNRARETANRVKCGSNMRQIGQAILLYANENKGNYPRTIYSTTATAINGSYDGTNTNTAVDWATTPGSTRLGNNDVIGAIFLLIRTQDITPEVFVCPSSNDEKDTYGTVAGISAQCKVSFSKAANLSYSMANPYPDTTAVNNSYKLNVTTGAEFAIAADKNPAGSTQYTGLGTALETSSSQIMQTANSPNHQGQGENVLYGDGHAEFQQNPFCGTKRDCIYTASPLNAANPGQVTSNKQPPNTKGGTITCIPTWSGDSVLLPAVGW
jgi:prepilin-type N-terminal cleavage/methylation domain-containing protein/prepilin-type processing-associated H-X9-DG protein